MRSVCSIFVVLLLMTAGLARADDPPRRTTRVASGPARTATATVTEPAAPAPKAPLTAKPATPNRRESDRLALLEPTTQIEGVGRGMVACFQVDVGDAAVWQLVVHEIGGPVAQIFEGQGAPPSRIPWDGSLLDGNLAWSGMTYTYYVAYADSTGDVGEVAGAPFTLPEYSREDRHGLSFLMPGQRLVSGRRGDPVATAAAGLGSVADRLNQDSGLAAVRIEVLARDETAALKLGEIVRTALAGLLEPGDRPVDLYVGAATAAPAEGTVLITTAPVAAPSS